MMAWKLKWTTRSGKESRGFGPSKSKKFLEDIKKKLERERPLRVYWIENEGGYSGTDKNAAGKD